LRKEGKRRRRRRTRTRTRTTETVLFCIQKFKEKQRFIGCQSYCANDERRGQKKTKSKDNKKHGHAACLAAATASATTVGEEGRS